ncbi:MFS transporter [Streptomyces sp. ISL-43]|nr:MFS transporter [Streptomyces sp. ISL-43]
MKISLTDAADSTRGSGGRLPALFRIADFRRFWIGDTVSQAGTAVTLLALPLLAIGTLGATPFEAGLLVMCEYLGFLLIGLPAGAWVDRMHHRRVMIAGDLGRAALLASLPAAAWLDILTLSQLYAVAFGMSLCTAFFDIASQSHLPRLVDDTRLVEANVALETTRTLTAAGGPGAGGALVGALTAPVAIVFDAVSFLISALCLSRIRGAAAKPEPRTFRCEPRSPKGSVSSSATRSASADPHLRDLQPVRHDRRRHAVGAARGRTRPVTLSLRLGLHRRGRRRLPRQPDHNEDGRAFRSGPGHVRVGDHQRCAVAVGGAALPRRLALRRRRNSPEPGLDRVHDLQDHLGRLPPTGLPGAAPGPDDCDVPLRGVGVHAPGRARRRAAGRALRRPDGPVDRGLGRTPGRTPSPALAAAERA